MSTTAMPPKEELSLFEQIIATSSIAAIIQLSSVSAKTISGSTGTTGSTTAGLWSIQVQLRVMYRIQRIRSINYVVIVMIDTDNKIRSYMFTLSVYVDPNLMVRSFTFTKIM